MAAFQEEAALLNIAEELLPGLDAIIDPLPAETRRLAVELVAFIADHPGLVGKVMPGWRSVNFRHAKAGYVCAVLPQAERVSLYFQRGSMLSDPDDLLVGETGKKGRILRLRPGEALPAGEIGAFLAEAIALFA